MSESAPTKRVAVIGAGVAGITCAQALRGHGFDPVMFEKSRGVGGRLATRRAEGDLTIDHGAQFMTARTPDFQNVMRQAIAAGTVAPWSPDVRAGNRPAQENWFVGVPTMNAFLKPMISGVEAHFGCELATIVRAGTGWRIKCVDPAIDETFQHVVCTVPAPQAQKLLAEDRPFGDRLADVSVAPCWALLFGIEGRLDVKGDLWRSNKQDVSLLARNASKPDRQSEVEGWIAHACPTWSIRHLEHTADDARDLLLALVGKRLGVALPALKYVRAHRWRYALTTAPLGAPYISTDDRTLFVGGDWCLGARVECAYQSGAAIAAALIEALD